MDSILGRTLGGKYRILRLIGRGGMGTVYEAEHVILNRHVAIKVLLPVYTSSTSSVKRFIREGQMTSAIDHPNIVHIYDFCKDPDGTVYIVMELLKGASLKTVLDQRGPLPLSRAISIAINVLSALQATHAKGIIHRDLKPENIFLTSTDGKEQVKIVDFGIAKFSEIADAAMRLTMTGSVPGTPYYLAPELANGGKNVDERIDIWSMGVVLYEMLTGRVPFTGDNYNEVISRILMSEVTPVRTLSSDVPKGLANAVEKALSKKREDRFLSADKMYEALLPFSASNGAVIQTTAVLRGIGVTSAAPVRNGKTQVESKGASSRSPQLDSDMDIELLKSSDLLPLSPRRPIWPFFLLSGVVIVVIWGVLMGLTSDNDSVQAKALPESGGQKTGPHVMKTPAISEPGTSKEAKPKKEQVKAPGADVDEPPSSKVIIDIDGLPAKSRITVDGIEMQLPLALPRSDSPVVVTVVAFGYQPQRQTIIPSGDRRLSIAMKKEQARKVKTEKKTGNRKEKGNSAWRANPFAN